MKLTTTMLGQNYTFKTIKELLAKANEEKSGDALAGIAAVSAAERIAAKTVLSEVTLNTLRNNPVAPFEEDAVTRLIDDDLDKEVFSAVGNWTVAELREYILSPQATTQDLVRLGCGLTGEMVAAVAKIMSNLDLVLAAAKITVQATANTTIGIPGTLASRLQPNHPTDSVAGILASAQEGLAYGVGDAVIGINPVEDSIDNISRILEALHEFRTYWQIPTQYCVLAHVTTQMEVLERGIPCDLVFQSLAGTEDGNKGFGITIPLLEEAVALAGEKSTAKGSNVMYFETGQGSELSSHSHYGADQLTLEARCYGLARHFRPFLVNTVVGFIGPEYLYDSKQVIRAGLEDHFMGKLSGLPMGVDACYTNHMKADQNDIENLAVLLSVAGVNYFMGIPMGDDVMLNYQCTSYHDIAALREVLNLKPLPAFEKWLEKMGLWENGRLTAAAGDPSIFQRTQPRRAIL